MWPRKLLDIGWSDLAFAGRCCIFGRENDQPLHELEGTCGGHNHALVCLSVRTGFDLLLQALQLPLGSEVIMTAITIPDMIEIVRRHGLVPVPLDLEFDTLAPSLESLRRTITSSTRLIVVAHLFGIRVPMGPILDISRQHNLIVVDDCAQAFEGWESIACSQTSAEAVDVSLYSFGPIKTATSLGGAVVIVRDTRVLAAMRAIHDRYTVQPRRSFALRILKYATMKLASRRLLYAGIIRTCLSIKKDADSLINSLARNFGKRDLFENIRRQPCKPLIAMVARRSRKYPRTRIKERTELGEQLKRLLTPTVAIPGNQSQRHSYWVFPISIDDSNATVQLLRQSGYDATQSHNLVLLESPSDVMGRDAPIMRQLLRNIVFLPVYPELSSVAIERMAHVLTQQTMKRSDGSKKA